MNSDFLHSDISTAITVIVAILLVVFVIVPVFFKSKKSVAEIDPKLAQIAKQLLADHLESMNKGKLVSESYISDELLPALKTKMAEFKSILDSGVQVDSEVKNIDQANLTVMDSSDETIKIKISALFKHEYLHNGKIIENPGNPESYVPENNLPEFDSSYYIMNFKIKNGSDYELIGIDDNIMGNKYGEL